MVLSIWLMALPAPWPADSRGVRMIAQVRSLVWTTRLAGALAALLAAGLWLCLATNTGTAAAQAGAQPPARDCASSGPAGGSYTVTICLALPPGSTALSGVFPVTATAAVSGRNSGPANIDFFLGGNYILGDYAAPFTFLLPSRYFADGPYRLEAQAHMKDGYVTARAATEITLQNGITTPQISTTSFAPWLGGPNGGTSGGATAGIKVAAVGDGAGSREGNQQVSDLIVADHPDMFLYLGDVYERGAPAEYYNWYGQGDQLYSRLRAITNPVVGNHEYLTPDAAGYFAYWGHIPHYYSYDAGGWHFVALDSTETYSQSSPTSEQYKWLQNDLQRNSLPCVLAYYHHPRFSIGPQGDTARAAPLWSLLAQHGVDVVLNGHDHSYQRWEALDGAGTPAQGGITEFVVGTGGYGTQGFVRTDPRVAASSTAYGAWFADLYPDRLEYRFVDPSKKVIDAGTIQCEPAGTEVDSPTTPAAALAPLPANPTTPGSTSASAGGVLCFAPDADAYVDASHPAANFGNVQKVRVDASPNMRTYLRFPIRGLRPPSLRATLYLWASSTSNHGWQARAVRLPVSSAVWNEDSITYANAPLVGSTAGASGPIQAETWTHADVTGLVSGEGVLDIAVVGQDAKAIALSSREGPHSPLLVVVPAGDAGGTVDDSDPLSACGRVR
jgi:hypothetical protein